MRMLSKAKWMTASGGIICLAAILALSITLPGKQALRIGRLSHVSRDLRASSAPAAAAASSSHVDVVKHYGQLPLAFEPNSSASSSEAKFFARGNGYALFLANHEAVLELRGPSKTPAVLRMQLAGANAAPRFTALEKLPGTSNYFIGNDPAKWRTSVPQFAKVLEHDVYPGVNLVYYGTQGRLEYDFDVAPGIDPSIIQLTFQGARDVRIDAQGELVAHTPSGDVRLRKPVAYQEIAGSKRLVAVSYALKNSTSASFQVAEYDPRQPLVIDPILIYSTYLGGSNIDSSNSIAVAPDNTAFIAGSTFSSDFPTVHGLQTNRGVLQDFPSDGFVSKISQDGSTLLYSTYLGGKDQDAASGIAVDNFGDAYVTGYTHSSDFPITFGSANGDCGGDGECGATFNTQGLIVSNAFVTELNPAGSNIIYSTFFGEYEQVVANAIAVDANGNAYITGRTGPDITPTVTTNGIPPPFPITSGAFQTSYGGGSTNAFVAKIGATGTSVLYSSYLGGNTEDVGYGIAVDGSANAFVTGLSYSSSASFPTSAGALQVTNGGAGDAFVTKVNTSASGAASLVYSTFLGGTGLDQGNAIAVDSNGKAYIAGLTNSAVLPFTTSGFQPAYKGEGDAFVAELGATGTLTYFTYLGGTHADSANAIAVDSTFNAYVTGTTASTDFPTGGAVFQPAYGGGNTDGFVAKIGPGGATLVYSSYLGGTNAELATGIAVDTSGSAYVTGQTCSQDFPLANPLQAVPGGNCDAYIAKVSILDGFSLNPNGLIFTAQSLNTTSQSQTVTVTNGDTTQTITSITVSGPNASDFSKGFSKTCGSSLGVGATCTITVFFTPSAAGIRHASVNILDSTNSVTYVLNLTGNTSTVTLSTSSLTFGPQAVGTVSSIQGVTVTNSGTTPLTFSSITSSGDFFEGDTCTKAPLQPGSNCVIQVDFAPSAAIASVGSITISDNGSGSPQVILATGTGILEPSFQIGSLSAASSVSAGQTARYSLSVTSQVGFSQQVGLSCSAPATMVCTISPSTVVPTSTQTQSAVLTISTATRTLAPPGFGIKIEPPALLRHFGGALLLWLIAIFTVLTAAAVRRRPITAAFGFAVVLLLASVACSSGGASGVPAGTPAGTYQVMVTGISGSVTNSAPITVQVK